MRREATVVVPMKMHMAVEKFMKVKEDSLDYLLLDLAYGKGNYRIIEEDEKQVREEHRDAAKEI